MSPALSRTRVSRHSNWDESTRRLRDLRRVNGLVRRPENVPITVLPEWLNGGKDRRNRHFKVQRNLDQSRTENRHSGSEFIGPLKANLPRKRAKERDPALNGFHLGCNHRDDLCGTLSLQVLHCSGVEKLRDHRLGQRAVRGDKVLGKPCRCVVSHLAF